MTTLLLLGRLVLAAVLGTAGLAKLADRAGTRRAVVDFGAPERWAAPVALLLPLAELVAAVALVPATTARWGALVALLLLSLFVAAIGVNLARGRKLDCHCFGQLHSAPAGWPTLLRNVVLAAGAAFVVVAGWDDGGTSLTGWTDGLGGGEALTIVVGLALAALVLIEGWAIFNLLRQHGRLLLRIEALEAGDGGASGGRGGAGAGGGHAGLPVGTAAPAFQLPTVNGDTRSLGDLLAASKPLILVFTDPGCGPCSGLMPDLAHWQRDHAQQLTVALISSGTVDANRAKATELGLSNVLVEPAGNEVASSYHYLGTPSAVVVDARGRIATPVVAGPVAIRSLFHTAVGHHVEAAWGIATGGNGARGDGASGAGLSRPAPLVARPGQLAPSFELPDLAGATRCLADFGGHDTLLVFWNPACGFCQRLLPGWKEWESTGAAGGRLQTVVVSTGPVADNVALGLRSPVLVDAPFEVGPTFGATGTPMAVLIDSEGRVASEVAAGASAVLALANRADDSAASADGAAESRPAEEAKA